MPAWNINSRAIAAATLYAWTSKSMQRSVLHPPVTISEACTQAVVVRHRRSVPTHMHGDAHTLT